MSSPRRTLPKAALMTALTLWSPATASADPGDHQQGSDVEVIGNLRLLGAFLHYADSPLLPSSDDGLAATVARAVARGNISGWLDFELNVFAELERTAGVGTLGGAFATASVESPYRTPTLEYAPWEDGSVRGLAGLDVGMLRAAIGPVDITAGRFPLNHSVTYLFTPNDFFAPFSATAINKVYKAGVDGLSARVELGDFSGLEVHGVLGYGVKHDRPRWGRSALLARLRTLLGNVDTSILAGKLSQRWVVGASVQGELGPVGVRAEGHAGLADKNGDGDLDPSRWNEPDRVSHERLAVGVDRSFSTNNTHLAVEYCYISDGGTKAERYLERIAGVFPDDLPYLGSHHVGFSGATELTPLLRANLLMIANATDGSGLAALFAQYSLADEAELLGGVMLPWGDTQSTARVPVPSELGLAPRNVYVETRMFF